MHSPTGCYVLFYVLENVFPMLFFSDIHVTKDEFSEILSGKTLRKEATTLVFKPNYSPQSQAILPVYQPNKKSIQESVVF